MIDNEKYDRAIEQMNKQFKKSGIKVEGVPDIKYDYICDGCSGELKVDAWVVWDADKQDFIVDNVFVDQDRWCTECDDFMDIKEVNADIYDKNQKELF